MSLPLPVQPRCPDLAARALTIFLWIPALAFLVPYGVDTGSICPAIGMIPTTLSALIGVVHVTGRARSQPLNIALDLFAACFLLGILIPGWVTLAESSRWYSSVGTIMVGTYGTAAMMLSL